MPEKTRIERDMLIEARKRGIGARVGTFIKLSGPGWLQSAITLGGGSLASSLFLGVIAGYSMLWLQPCAMILGVIMLCAISYVTLSIESSPFHAIRTNINPVLAWGWALASLMANMIWVLPQYSLAYGAITENLFPNAFHSPTEMSIGAKMAISLAILGVVTHVTFCYGRQNIGIRIYEWIIKGVVACIVLSFMGVVVSLASEIDWNELLQGFVPNPRLLVEPAVTMQAVLDTITDPEARAFWTEKILGEQRDRMIAAASTAVGINMTFLLPYSMLSKKWGREFRNFAIFDLATGMIIPFMLAVSCVIIASGAQFHTKPYEGLLQKQPDGTYVVNKDSDRYESFQNHLAERNRYEDKKLADTPVGAGEKEVAAMLVKRSNTQLASSLEKFTGSKIIAHKIFGLGVLGMALSTISVLMLISGFVICEIFRFPHGGWQHQVGTLCAGTGILWPFLWTSGSSPYLAIPTSVFNYVLLPVAFVTFFLTMNSKRILGERRPKGFSRWLWNVLMGISIIVTVPAAIWTALNKNLKVGEPGNETVIPLGTIGLIAFLFLVVLGHFYIRSKHAREEGMGNT